MAKQTAKKTTRKKRASKKPAGFKQLYTNVINNIKIISIFSFIFMVVGFCLGVYSDIMKVGSLEEEIKTLNSKIDNLVTLIIGNSSQKFEEKSKAPKILGEE